MWPAAKSYTIEKFNWHMARIQEKCPDAIAYLDKFNWHMARIQENVLMPLHT
jgi:hypothetical protein